MADNKKFMEGLTYAAGATVGVAITIGLIGAATGWKPFGALQTQFGAIQSKFAGRVSPINPNLDYSTIKGLPVTRVGRNAMRVRTI